jgi:hypothetical protein
MSVRSRALAIISCWENIITALTEHAIVPGGISCRVTEEANGGRRYLLQVPASAVHIADACVQDLMTGRYRLEVAAAQEAVAAGVAALHRLLERVKLHWHTGQSRRVVTFLAGLYGGSDYPFDLTELRGLDSDIAADCLAVLRLDSLGQQEVHRYVENGDALWHELIGDYGLKPIVRT